MSPFKNPPQNFWPKIERDRTDPFSVPIPILKSLTLVVARLRARARIGSSTKIKVFFAQNIIGLWSLPKTINGYWAGTKLYIVSKCSLTCSAQKDHSCIHCSTATFMLPKISFVPQIKEKITNLSELTDGIGPRLSLKFKWELSSTETGIKNEK